MTDFNKILEKAKEIELKVKESQEKIKNILAEGTSGGGDVKVVLNGDGEIQSLFISDKLFKEDKSLIEDLVIAAITMQKIISNLRRQMNFLKLQVVLAFLASNGFINYDGD